MAAKITQAESIYIAMIFFIGNVMRTIILDFEVQNEAWLVLITAGILFIPFTFVYIDLMRAFPGKNLFEINSALFGNLIGTGVNVIYLIYISGTLANYVLHTTWFVATFILNETPVIATAILIMSSATYVVFKGIEPLASLCTFFYYVLLITLLGNLFLCVNHAELSFFFPIFTKSIPRYIQSMHNALSNPYGDLFLLFGLAGHFEKKFDAKRFILSATILGGLSITLIYLKEVITLGPMLEYQMTPSLESVRMIELGGDDMLRLESVTALLWVVVIFFKICFLFYITLIGFKDVFRLSSYKPYLSTFCILFTAYGVSAVQNRESSFGMEMNVHPFIVTTFSYLLPLIMVGVLHFRKIFRTDQSLVTPKE
jgi:spore germination protein KB